MDCHFQGICPTFLESPPKGYALMTKRFTQWQIPNQWQSGMEISGLVRSTMAAEYDSSATKFDDISGYYNESYKDGSIQQGVNRIKLSFIRAKS